MAGKVGNTRPDQETAQNPVKIVPPLRFVPPPVARRQPQRQKTPRRPKDHARSQRDSAAGKRRHADARMPSACSTPGGRRACPPPQSQTSESRSGTPSAGAIGVPRSDGRTAAAVEGQSLPSAPPEPAKPSDNRQTAPPVPESSHRRRRVAAAKPLPRQNRGNPGLRRAWTGSVTVPCRDSSRRSCPVGLLLPEPLHPRWLLKPATTARPCPKSRQHGRRGGHRQNHCLVDLCLHGRASPAMS